MCTIHQGKWARSLLQCLASTLKLDVLRVLLGFLVDDGVAHDARLLMRVRVVV
jgi:hypothetical protein